MLPKQQNKTEISEKYTHFPVTADSWLHTGRDAYCEFYRKPVPQIPKISDMVYQWP